MERESETTKAENLCNSIDDFIYRRIQQAFATETNHTDRKELSRLAKEKLMKAIEEALCQNQ